MKHISTVLLIILMTLGLVLLGPAVSGEELPKPTYDNSLVFSMTHNFMTSEAVDIDIIKSQFGNGLYAPLCFSSFQGVDMAWQIDLGDAGSGIQEFKDEFEDMLAFAKLHQVGIHLTLTYGLSRTVEFYSDAKAEDIRNCQWYNDNNISSQAQMGGDASASDQGSGEYFPYQAFNHAETEMEPKSYTQADSSVINKYVFGTYSRYARKLRGHLDAKITALFAYLAQKQAANPDVLMIMSAPGEVELNYNRLNGTPYLQDYFCDYSPFAVLEFRDWIKHEGLYADGEKYAGEGYENGGSRYQGASGLSNFNADFGTSFTSWNLKYYNWSLSDPVDADYSDTTNPDPNKIPVSQYTYNGMKPSSGSKYISGGFDPPRVMQELGSNDFYDLWHTFRELLVYHYVKDMADIARASGFPKDRYFSHQIPGDYLFGKRPADLPNVNARYYASASPMWTANVYPDSGLGVTLYDINFGTHYARTTQYGIGGAAAMSDNWAALEYNPEVIPPTVNTTPGPVSTIYDQMIRLYNGSPHVISFFKWRNKENVPTDYQFKDTNRGTAAKQFFDAIKDKARKALTTKFTPKKVENFSGYYNNGVNNLSWSSRIWTDLSHDWTDWGDFKEFVIYRGYSADFAANSSSQITRKTGYSHVDFGFNYATTVYYKIGAVNADGVVGPLETIAIDVPDFVPTPILSLSRERLNFAYVTGQAAPPTQAFRVINTGTGSLNWTAVDDAEWLSLDPAAQIGNAVVTVTVDPTGLAVGTYSAIITVTDPLAIDSPQTITVSLTIKNSTQNQLPFGSFDTPIDNSTVMSSIAVTGWVLDDIGVSSVKLYRDPVGSEGKSLVYIGDANFVEGARPDIEAAYPDYPCNYKAGWGYMMLTNFLPNGGNGVFKISAIATDAYNKQVTLGTKTITCDNAHAVKPFGAIDTPTQGGDASGGSFINWGWVLTPQPNSIATDGSTLNVYIDGVQIGHPKYNINRSDIAELFPGYANSGGAAGYFILDTTAYSDSIHTIQWTARDSAGNTDGIGSRYFAVQNGSSDSSGTASQAGRSSRKNTAVPFTGDLSSLPFDSSQPIDVIAGYGEQSKTNPFSPGKDGVITIETRELDRIELHFPGETLNISKLPIGSTLDSRQGVFYWQLGAGFLGDYIFEFAVKQGVPGQLTRKQVKIKVIPRFQ